MAILTREEREINRRKKEQAERERLELIQGLQGKDGLSAYEVAVKNGFVGTEPEWLQSLAGSAQLSVNVEDPITYNGQTNTISMKIVNGGSF